MAIITDSDFNKIRNFLRTKGGIKGVDKSTIERIIDEIGIHPNNAVANESKLKILEFYQANNSAIASTNTAITPTTNENTLTIRDTQQSSGIVPHEVSETIDNSVGQSSDTQDFVSSAAEFINYREQAAKQAINQGFQHLNGLNVESQNRVVDHFNGQVSQFVSQQNSFAEPLRQEMAKASMLFRQAIKRPTNQGELPT
ncbi:hypothetical protein G7B40_041175 [Aetokthonos hydrillicola Thurmond2011]|jgi:hypothetical protein|uniref:Uncharacterized protein n=1 Tax=Aetokthonos hydrillicola Thurmond2011 TaxID=2712845 RepID=A0AAP5IIT6_9CYAN|nr:hypothetical protein [Aetokthonos hydrillicola]MBW4591131.1 hypothetical protein [Aetokthonos hydrillicola CCALA 1050]MDR9900900.1 hypothetical protein [Aetokthonos hydrillicola Thurmond2011]